MKTSTKFLSDTKVVVSVTLGAEELAIAEQVATAKLAKNVKVAGFRKGKTPAAVAAKNIDPQVLQEQIINDAISKSVAEAFLENAIQALDRPAVQVAKFVPNEILEFTAEADILPKIKLGNYKKFKIKSEKISVKPSDIDEIIERMRHGLADKKEVKRAAISGDEATIDFIGKKDGIVFDGGTGKNYPLTLGSGQFVPGFENGVIGHKTGETFDVELTFPVDYGSAELKGAKVTFSVTINSLKELVLPVVDDKFAVKSGPFKTLVELMADIERELTSQKEHEIQDGIKDQLITQLIETSKVSAPDVLVIDQSNSIEQDFLRNLQYQGLSIEQYLENKGFATRDDWMSREVKPVAEKRVKASLVLAELSKAEKIEATNVELDTEVERFKTQYAKNPEVLKQFDNPEVRRDIANRLLTEKTVNRLVELNTK